MLEKVSAALNTTPTIIQQTPHISKNPTKKKQGNRFVQFGQESNPAWENLHHSEQLWMLENVSAALNSTPSTNPQAPHISKNPQKKNSRGIPLVRYAESC